jgi:hypothetical protein
MANISKVIAGAAIAAVSIASPALAAHKSKPSSAHQNGYVARSNQGSGVRAFASVPRSVDDPAGRPYVYVPGEAFQGGGY